MFWVRRFYNLFERMRNFNANFVQNDLTIPKIYLKCLSDIFWIHNHCVEFFIWKIWARSLRFIFRMINLIISIFFLSYIPCDNHSFFSQHFENVRKGLVWACSRNEIVVEIMKGHVNHNTARVFEYYYDEIIVINKKRSKNYWRKIKWF